LGRQRNGASQLENTTSQKLAGRSYMVRESTTRNAKILGEQPFEWKKVRLGGS